MQAGVRCGRRCPGTQPVRRTSMADKKVERNIRTAGEESSHTPTQKLRGSLSQEGVVNMADSVHDKGRSNLLRKFRRREERYRRNQALAASQEGQQRGSAEEEEGQGEQLK